MRPAITDRKLQHLELATREDAESSGGAGWSDVRLPPATLPEHDHDEVDLTTSLAGVELRAPLVLASMTGGHPATAEVNARLGRAAQTLGLAVGVGSQRAALRRSDTVPSFRAVRRHAPDAVVVANIGACQLVDQPPTPAVGPADLRRLVEMVDAQFLAIHLNVLQELVQPEGDRRFRGLVRAIADAVESAPVPVIVKETGAGMTRATATTLAGAGVAAIDVGGAGGTSFARVEGLRDPAGPGGRTARLGATFASWGVPTAVSVMAAVGTGPDVIATGGVRTGLDAARALALGATAVGIGRPALLGALDGDDALTAVLDVLLEELRIAMTLVGATDVPALRATTPVLTGDVLAWASQQGLPCP